MGSESEKCVDQLLLRLTTIGELLLKFQLKDSDKTNDALNVEAREFLSTTQAYIDNNRTVIPPYYLKKVDDALRNLNDCLNQPQKTKLQFKFKPKDSPQTFDKKPSEPIKQGPIKEDKGDCLLLPTATFFGVKNKSGDKLILEDAESRDYNLINLENCSVEVHNLCSAIYIEGLKDSSVACFSKGSITVRGCSGCRFELACQQLRIDTSTRCTFGVHAAAGCMLESSKDLKFKLLNLDECHQKASIIYKCEFTDKVVPNNWKSINDFDCLSGEFRNFDIIE